MTHFSDRTKRRIILRSTALLPKPIRLWARYGLLANLERGKARARKLRHHRTSEERKHLAADDDRRAYQIKYDLPPTVALKTDELARMDARIPRFCVSNGYYTYERALASSLLAMQSTRKSANKPVVLLVRHPADIAVSWYIQFTKRVSPAKRELINASLEHPIDIDT